MTSLLAAVCRGLARVARVATDPDDDLRRAVAFLGWTTPSPDAGTESPSLTDAEAVERAGVGSAIVVTLAGLPLLAVAPRRLWPPVVLAVGLVAVGARVAIPTGVRLLANARRRNALGAAPDLVARAVLRMRLEPSPESAAAFAARTGSGRLARSLRLHLRHSAGDPGSALERFGSEWAEWFPSLRRALVGIESAGDAQEDERVAALDGALSVVLDGTREATAAFAASARTPATALYAFGVLLPLTLVALLPAAGAAGVAVTVPVLVVGYDVVLPLALVATSAWLLARRPAAFPTERIPRSHPEVPDGPHRAGVAGAVAGALAAALACLLYPAWTVPLAAAGCGVGTGLFVHARPARAVRERARRIESGLPDALAMVGRRVQRGLALESALEAVAEEASTETAAVFATACRNQRVRGDGIEEALLGPEGALATVPSVRARSTGELLVLAAREGRPAGDALVAMADHLRDLDRVETETRRTIANVTRTLSNTAAVFAPLVGGATVTLADGIGGADLGIGGSVPPTPVLGLAVGSYVLVLSVVLAGLTAGLEQGVDRTVVTYRVGATLVSATVVFLLALRAVGLFV